MSKQALGDFFANTALGGNAVNRPALNAMVAQSQEMNSLRQAQTQDTEAQVPLRSAQTQQALAEAAAKQAEASSAQYKLTNQQEQEKAFIAKGDDPAVAHYKAVTLNAGNAPGVKDLADADETTQKTGFRATLGNALAPPDARLAASAGLEGHPVSPYVAQQPVVTNGLAPNAASNPQTVVSPLGGADIAAKEAAGNLANAKAAQVNSTDTDIDPNEVRTLGSIVANGGQLPAMGMGQSKVRNLAIRAAAEQLQGVTADKSTLFGDAGTLPKGWTLAADGKTAVKGAAGTPAAGTVAPDAAGAAQIGNKQLNQTTQQTLNDFAPKGKDGQTMLRLNTAIQHADTVDQYGDALGNGNMQFANEIANKWAAAFGKSAPTSMALAAQLMGGEAVAAATNANAGTKEERLAVANKFANANSPTQIHDATKALRTLLSGKFDALEQGYKAGTTSSENPQGLQDFRSKYPLPATLAAMEANHNASTGSTPKTSTSTPAAPPVGYVIMRDKNGNMAYVNPQTKDVKEIQ